MIAAIRAVRSDELSQNAAARQYDVPVATLHRRLKTGKKLAVWDWVYSFLKRNKTISLRTPENTSAARASGFNKASVQTFFNLLGSLIEKYKFTPSRINNCDETGLSTMPNKNVKVFSLKGKKNSATSHYTPPLIVIPRVRRNPIYEIGLPPETVVTFYSSGWMQSDIFSDIWFAHFLKHSHPTKENPVLLILDGHVTHVKNLKEIEKARENHVHILTIPPHTSHRLQPLDVAFMFPLSNYYTQELKFWQRNTPNKIVETRDVGPIFGKAYAKTASASTAVNEFRCTGIYPYNPNIFSDDLFAPSELTERENVINDENQVPKPNENILVARPKTPELRKQPEPQISPDEEPQCSYGIPRTPIRKPPLNSMGPRRRGKTTVITSSPYLAELKEAKNKCLKDVKQVKRKITLDTPQRRKVTKNKELSTSESEEEVLVPDDLC
ncbi:hypothetical protein NQ314_006966 [Rhamnusium bicolor]|uniref:HTH psq-type domain-containing protein n=1 Tax=Rhamnusium bicolor TaxID=1586634 RepID=A0AAV8YVT3_9CUCU|nr:hypothetical protein NQ314_006966 [Rhamnusium bicolor]